MRLIFGKSLLDLIGVGAFIASLMATWKLIVFSQNSHDHNNSNSNSNQSNTSNPANNGTFVMQRPKLTMKYQHDAVNQNQTKLAFRILQITDIHMGEAPHTDWGPANDERTLHAIATLVDLTEPDLIVLSGDQLTANNIHANATAYQKQLYTVLQGRNVPWCLVFGNHDDSPLEPLIGEVLPPKTSRQEMLTFDQTYSLSYSQSGLSDVHGLSNYAIDIYHPGNNASKVVLQALFLDTGGGTLKKTIDESQIRWLQTVRKRHVPGFSFQHIPTREFIFQNAACVGDNLDGGIAPLENDFGLIQSLVSDDNKMGEFLFVGVGHNHGNDYCCQDPSSKVALCFGRHSGYGGYGRSWARGGRVYDIEANNVVDGSNVTWSSFVQLDFGPVVHKFVPTTPLQ